MKSINSLKTAILQLDEILGEQWTLNALVIDEYTVSLPDDTEQSEDYRALIDQIMELAKQVRIECGNNPGIYLQELASIQNDTNEEFLNWLFDYMETAYKVYTDALPFQKMDISSFKEIVNYCFDNFILQMIDTDEIAEDWESRLEDILKLRRIINVYIRLILWDNRSKHYAYNYMDDKFGLSQEHCDVIYQKIDGNEEKLWRRLLTKRVNYIESCIERLEKKINAIE